MQIKISNDILNYILTPYLDYLTDLPLIEETLQMKLEIPPNISIKEIIWTVGRKKYIGERFIYRDGNIIREENWYDFGSGNKEYQWTRDDQPGFLKVYQGYNSYTIRDGNHIFWHKNGNKKREYTYRNER